MILVTGGTGLVGSHLLFKLVEKGHPVRAIYRLEKKIDIAKHVFSYYSNQEENHFKKIEWIRADINDIPSLTNAFHGITHVYHCAALVSLDPKNYFKLRHINIEGTANVVNLCLTNSIEKLCYVSSISTIGNEQGTNLISENTHWNPEEDHNVYAITKYGAEMEVWRGAREGLNTVIVNPGIIIGPGFWHTGSGSFFKAVYKGMSYYTKGVEGYVDINDVTKPMIQLMESDIINQRYILVSENLCYKDFFTKIAEGINVKPPTKEASKLLLSFAWRLDWLRSNLLNKSRRLTKHTAQSVLIDSVYSNEKIVKTLNYRFTPIDESISESCRLFLHDLA